jgi:hypothetical protein
MRETPSMQDLAYLVSPSQSILTFRRRSDAAACQADRSNEIVQALGSASTSDKCGLAYTLVAESATNMLRSFCEVREAADRYGEAIAKDTP